MTGRRSRGERGSIAPLVIGLAAVVAMLVAVVVDVSATYLRREGLNALADAAALAATEGLAGEWAYQAPATDHPRIDPAEARRYVAVHLRSAGAGTRFPGLTWTLEVRGATVVVRLRAPFELPLRVPGSETSVVLTSTAAAVVSVSR